MTFAEWIRNFIDEIFHSRFVCHLEAEVLQLRQERDALQGKCDRFEVILMPLQSAGGAAYARSLQPPRKAELLPSLADVPRKRSWQEIQAEWERSQEAAADAELETAQKES
jgi:hypothetical protein